MKKNFFRAILSAAAAMLLVLGTSITAFAAENAKSVENAAGRSVIVQSVLGVSGSTQVIRGEKTFQPAKGVRLLEGDTVRTSGDNKVYIAIDGSMILRIDTDSEAVITKATFGQKLTVTLKAGRMFYNVAKQSSQNETLELVTNYVTIAIRGTSGELSTGNGKVQSMLFDGVIDVTDGTQVVQQVPGQMLSTALAPGNQTFKCLAVKDFTLADIPKSLVEEIKNDADLKDRVLKSVPVSTDPQGNKVFLDKETFDKTIYGVEDDVVFRDSVIRMGGSAGGGTNGGSGYSGGSSSGGSSGGSSDPDPAPTKITCPGCSQEITSGAAGHALVTTCVCGMPIYECSPQEVKDAHAEITYACENHSGPACKAGDHVQLSECTYCSIKSYKCAQVDLSAHVIKQCSACGESYCEVKEQADHVHTATCSARHTYCTKSETDKHVAVCNADAGGCGETYCPEADKTEKKHETVNYACGNHTGPKCQEGDHALEKECTYCNIKSYKCNPIDLTAHVPVTCPECSGTYCPVKELSEHAHHEICSLADGGCGETYCPIEEQTEHVHTAICPAGDTFCTIAELGDHIAVCLISEGGCGQLYCPSSSEAVSAHAANDTHAHTCGAILHECTYADTSSPLHWHEISPTNPYKCFCGTFVTACADLAAHELRAVQVGDHFVVRCNYGAQQQAPAPTRGSGGSDHYDPEPILKGETLGGSAFETKEQEKEEHEEIPETPSETIPEAEPVEAVECVAVVSAETSEKEEE